jgi:hypothetical protein
MGKSLNRHGWASTFGRLSCVIGFGCALATTVTQQIDSKTISTSRMIASIQKGGHNSPP